MAELDARRTEVLSGAAKIIQRRVRTHYARKRFIALREAAICVQALFRRKIFQTSRMINISFSLSCNTELSKHSISGYVFYLWL